MSRLVAADARKVSPREFLDALFPRRTPEEQAERVRLAREHQQAVKATWKLPFEQGMEERSRLSAEFNALVDAGKTEYMVVSDVLGEQLTEVRGDPFGDAFGPRCDPFGAQPPTASSCQHRIAIARSR